MPNDENSNTLVGRTLANKYTIESVVGTGAMGTIYRARQIALDKSVAVKVLHQTLASDPSFIDRFKLEAFSASRLEHPNSLRVLDFGKDDELLYLVMEYVEADNLLSIMQKEWPFEDERIAQITSQTLAALAKAHDVGIVHRDLKPENILVLRGTDDEGNPIDIVKVCDFGIAKLAIPVEPSHPFAPHQTTEGVIVGTPDYMSPEQARGEDVDARSDLYSMGVVLYHLLTGKTPFDSDTPLGIAVQHVSQDPVPPSAIRKVHPELEAVCLRAMSKKADDRYQSAREMRRAVLGAVGAGAPLVASALPIPTPTNGMTPIPVRARPRFATSTAPGAMDVHDEDVDETPMPIETPNFRPRRIPVRVALAMMGVAAVASAVIVQRPGSVFGSREVHSTTVALTPAPQEGSAIAPTAAPQPQAHSPTLTDEAPRPAALRTAEPRVEPRVEPRPSSAGRRTTPAPAPKRSEPAAPSTGAISAPSEPESPPAPVAEAAAPVPAAVETMVAPAPSPTPRAQAPVEPTPAPSPAPVDPSRASVSLGNITTSSGISGLKVKTAIAHAPFTACYRTALGKRGSGSAHQASLKIDIDLSGSVVGASLSEDGNLPGLRACVESAARGVKIRDVDTGDGSATIQLTFSPQ
jgi:serine/threonine-protein kinase